MAERKKKCTGDLRDYVQDAVFTTISIQIGMIVRELMAGVSTNSLREMVKDILEENGMVALSKKTKDPDPIPAIPEKVIDVFTGAKTTESNAPSVVSESDGKIDIDDLFGSGV